MKTAILFFMLLVISFLIAAKTHGRQHRLERELLGYWTVSFTSQNHPWVESFWFKQRIVYWSLAVAAEAFLITRFLQKTPGWNVYAFVLFSLAASMIVAFVFTGLMSAMRLAVKLSESTPVPGGDWLNDAIWGSVGLWLATSLSVTLLVLSGRKWFVLPFGR